MALPQINTPTYNIELPVCKQMVKFRPFLVREEKILMLALESQDPETMQNAMGDMMMACTDGTVNMDNYQAADLEFLFAHIRAKSVGETSKVVLKCDSCEEKNVVTINLQTVHIDGIPESDIVKLDDNISIRMRLLTVKQAAKAVIGIEASVDQIYGLLVASIEEIYYGDESFSASEHTSEEISAFIDQLSLEQFKQLQKWLEKIPVAQIDVKYICAKCGTTNEIELKGLLNFFG